MEIREHRPKANILVVDDTPEYSKALGRLLRTEGYAVSAAEDGAAALEAVKADPPDLILLDISMPRMDGYTCCEHLKRDAASHSIPVIFLSGMDGALNKAMAFAAGGVDFIAKPFDPPEILARIQTHLTLSTLQRDLEHRVAERTAELEAEVAERKQIEQELSDSRQRLRELAAHADAVREQERKRIAGEVHDELGSLLTALKMDLSLMRMQAGEDQTLLERVGQMRDLVDQTIQKVRHVATQLRPPALNLGIVPALEWLGQEFSQHSHIPIDLDAEDDLALDDAHATAIFRIVQESLTNVARHAQASRAEIRLCREEDGVLLQIRDDGRGMAADKATNRFGLLGIRERAHALGGSCDILSAPGQGCALTIRLPIEKTVEAKRA